MKEDENLFKVIIFVCHSTCSDPTPVKNGESFKVSIGD